MHNWTKILVPVAVALFTLTGVFVAVVYGASEWKIRQIYDIPVEEPDVSTNYDAGYAERMARIVGCWAGCHGSRGEGGVEKIQGIRRVTAPPLSSVLPDYSDAELFRLIVHGVKRNGRSAIGMSSFTFWSVGDPDISQIIRFLREQPPASPVTRSVEIPFRSRLLLLQGVWQLSADQVDKSQPRLGNMPRNTPFERGRYLATIVCTECHGTNFQGDPLEAGPSLAILSIYDEDEFSVLMRTSVAKSGRLIERMDWLPEVELTDQDISDLYAFLTHLDNGN